MSVDPRGVGGLPSAGGDHRLRLAGRKMPVLQEEGDHRV
jgi:hypothetical protein